MIRPRCFCEAFCGVVVDWKDKKINISRSARVQSALCCCWPALAVALSQVRVWGWTCSTGCWRDRASEVTWMWSVSWSTATTLTSGTVPSTVMILLSSLGTRCMPLHKQVSRIKLFFVLPCGSCWADFIYFHDALLSVESLGPLLFTIVNWIYCHCPNEIETLVNLLEFHVFPDFICH